jgi:hypothetical protein
MRPPLTALANRTARSIARRLLRKTPPSIKPFDRTGHLSLHPEPLSNRSAHDSGALSAYRRQMHRQLTALNANTVRRSAKTHRLSTNRLNAAELRQLYPFHSKRFHALLNSLFKVLCNFPSRYLFAIGLVAVFSLR